ncbi:NTP transferase domain-containing protein, partial [Escherichia coli]|nr:NTP transferase domain-containing protein [Escherichia coli]
MQDHPDAVMLFAAGRGTRMGALTATCPKPLIKVGDKALIDHALTQIDAHGPARIVANTHHLGDQVAAHLSDRPDIALSDESDNLLETGGGLRKALPLLGAGPVFTVNSDAVWTGPSPLTTLANVWNPDKMDA